MILAFHQGDLRRARVAQDEMRGGARGLLAFEMEGAGGEQIDERGVEITINRGAVDLGNFVFG